MSIVRKTAINALENIIKHKLFLSDVKNNFKNLEKQDLALINMMILTALRNLVFIKKTIRDLTTKKMPEKLYFMEYALILAITEILYLRTPEYATINSYVEIIKKRADRFAGGFINALLRNVCRNKEEIMAKDTGQFFPSEFIKILAKDYTNPEIKQIEAAARNGAKLDITVKSDPQKWATLLEGSNIAGNTIRLENSGNITNLEGYNEGEWFVQDVSASLPVVILGDVKGKRVLDLCSAPGGKTAQLINAGAIVTSLDIAGERVKILKENLERLHLKEHEIIIDNGVRFLREFSGEKFDIVLLDAPCSATGTVRRHPEIVHIKTIEDLKTQAILQHDFLKHCHKALKSGGTLVYCTCSINKIEGEEQIKKLMGLGDNFKIVPIKEKETNLCKDIITKEGFIRTLPWHIEGGMDSFFIAKLQKV